MSTARQARRAAQRKMAKVQSSGPLVRDPYIVLHVILLDEIEDRLQEAVLNCDVGATVDLEGHACVLLYVVGLRNAVADSDRSTLIRVQGRVHGAIEGVLLLAAQARHLPDPDRTKVADRLRSLLHELLEHLSTIRACLLAAPPVSASHIRDTVMGTGNGFMIRSMTLIETVQGWERARAKEKARP
ncbi:hypothetical protein Tamer19_34010 [Cupriavidus sp. TA19]|uniref:hypothetical protein n=1 Tax=Cupriavidus sp. TA19 TaxID=701108 RepID=UPI0027294A4C|nr:hypothetical protein [Cupriavidus sp. TA19]GLC93993.1 hypothetical protein Tamer19_34010 [Cupriavidus sp. TA19]